MQYKKIIKAKEKKSKKLEKEEEEEEEEKEKKEEKKDSEKSEKSSEEEEKNNNNNSEPKLVKNSNKEEEDLKKEKKSYNSGTWPELFVNNLSYKTTDSSLKKYFSKYGEVESTKIVVDKETGRPKGVGFCKFCDSESAAKALADNDNLFLDGRPLAVSYSNDKKGSAKVRKSKFQGDKNFSGEKFSIFIGNLSFKTNEDGIKNLFEDCGNIIDIRIAKRPDGNPRGFAHVDFDSKEAMENALEKTGYRLDGRELRIDKTTNQPSANKKTFGENSYYKYKKENKGEKEEKDENNIDIEKAKKTGKIINTIEQLKQRFCLIYTGERRLARNLLKEVVKRYIGNVGDNIRALDKIKSLADEMTFALENGNIDLFASLLNCHLQYSKMIDAGATNGLIDKIFDIIDDMIDGKMVCGAGGGGFLQVILKKNITKEMLHNKLRGVFPDSEIDVWECNIDF